MLYELHVGAFTPEGTFEAAAARLPALAELGITHVELMPIAEFPGHHGWGYDGVYLSAAHSAYGGPHGLARLVDAAHAAGLGVILDVVYNHVGASGVKALEAFGPFFTERHETPWGKAVNFDGEDSDGVREWVLQSATGWVRDFHVDGLRLDAIHAIHDDGARHVLRELAERVRAENRRALVVAESGLNDPKVIRPRAPGRLRPRCRVGRRLPPRPARAAHGRALGVVRGVRPGGAAGQGLPSPARARRRLLDLPPPALRRPRRRPGTRPVRRLQPEPRPGRQPRLR